VTEPVQGGYEEIIAAEGRKQGDRHRKFVVEELEVGL
jgi:hypothetical protein